MPELILPGCTPEPLMSYLKALGILRLVAEQADCEVRGAWRSGTFVVSSGLDEDTLTLFFLEKYRPTPILSPWNAGCGFYLKWDPKRKLFKSREVVDAINALSNSTTARLTPYRAEIQSAKTALAQLARPIDVDNEIHGKPPKEQKEILDAMLLFQLDGQTFGLEKADKDDFLARVRSDALSDASLNWLDAALVLLTGRKKNRAEAPILGSGGNIGNSDFSGMFIQLLKEIISFDEETVLPSDSHAFFRAAVFGTPVKGLSEGSIGQFNPGKAGGANAGQGMEAGPLLNPWDYILMLEGALLLGGAVSRRQAVTTDRAVFPFVVESSGVGYGSAAKDNTRGELWLPLWHNACSVGEIRLLFGEGRAEIGRHRATSGVTFARAVASLSVDRGIDSFIRYEFQERLGQNYLASPLGYFEVLAKRNVDLIKDVDVDEWLDKFHWACRAKDTPPRFVASLRRIDAAIFDFCRYGGASRMAELLCALGNAERQLANGEKFRKTEKRTIYPVPPLSPSWIAACDDESIEFRLALALSSIRGDQEGKIGDIKVNLEPVEHRGSRWTWTEGSRAVVWSSADLCRNLVAILMRRVMDANRGGLDDLPVGGRFRISLDDVPAFLAGETDDRKVEELLWGLILIDGERSWREPIEHVTRSPKRSLPLPHAYALLKLAFSPHRLSWPVGAEGVRVKPEPEILGRLRAGDAEGACEIAARRLRASGFVPMPGSTPARTRLDINPSPRLDAVRLAATLLLPISDTVTLARLALRPPSEEPEEAIV